MLSPEMREGYPARLGLPLKPEPKPASWATQEKRGQVLRSHIVVTHDATLPCLRRASFELERSRLLRAAGQPFPAKFFGNLFVGECTPGFDIGSPAGYGLDNVKVVEHVIQTAVVWESVEHGLHGFFGLH